MLLIAGPWPGHLLSTRDLLSLFQHGIEVQMDIIVVALKELVIAIANEHVVEGLVHRGGIPVQIVPLAVDLDAPARTGPIGLVVALALARLVVHQPDL